MSDNWYVIDLRDDRIHAVEVPRGEGESWNRRGLVLTKTAEEDLRLFASRTGRELLIRRGPFSHVRGYFPNLGANVAKPAGVPGGQGIPGVPGGSAAA